MGRYVVSALAALALFGAGCSRNKIDLTSDLAGRWPLGTNISGVLAPIQATLTGGVSLVTTTIGPAYQFDGQLGRVLVADAPEYQFRAGQNFSILAWIAPEQADTSFGVMSIVEKRKVGGITSALGYSLHLEYGKLACQLTPAPGFAFKVGDLASPKRLLANWKAHKQLQSPNRFISQQPDLRDGKFHQVALTLDRDSTTGGKLYVDGKVVLTFDPTKLRGGFVNAEPLMIGTHPDQTLHCSFRGKIGGVHLYRRALSPAEVNAAK